MAKATIKPASQADWDLCGIGEISLDHVGVAPEDPPSGGKTELAQLDDRPGGTVATAALAARRLGLRVSLQGVVGDEPAGERALAPLDQAGVHTASVRRLRAVATRRALILVDAGNGERRVYGFREPGLSLGPQDLDEAAIQNSRLLLMDTSDLPAAERAATVARAAGTVVILDAEQVGQVRGSSLLGNVDFPIVSEAFARAYGPDHTIEGGLKALAGQGAVLPVATCGEQGARAWHAGESLSCPAFPVTAVDTTGAGDAFRAGFAWALLSEGAGADPMALLRKATAVAAVSCCGEGAQGGLESAAVVEAFLASPPSSLQGQS